MTPLDSRSVGNPFYQRARFVTAAAGPDRMPPDSGREVAFAGRSNAGKSSAINALCHQNRLARTSKTPGRTRQLIFFALDETRRLVDLPGYGYAKVSETVKLQWQRLLAAYLEQRRSLAGLVVVMDIRHPLTAFDRQLLAWGRRTELEMLLLLTKSDKLKRGAARAERDRVIQAVAAGGRVRVELFSARTRSGIEPVHALLDRWLDVQGTV
ncbi:MAG: ribosome biogenesis GTP-binding protein YihA/YsxC [Candidatus Thiosymbion ectosymbiont of Robbea hypermnestra]|nr:ribosome biogenesis GTP-binding protein YihA/YsxC [Candidatus Thiosymbion ectosymbiont of Robbea hypermnestra]